MKKIKGIYIILILSLVLNCVWMFGGCVGIPVKITLNKGGSGNQEEAVAEGVADISSHEDEIAKKLQMIDKVINSYYLYEEEIDQDKMLEGIYAGYVDGLEEAYTSYYTSEEFSDMMESSAGEYSGIGVSVSQNVNTGIITVVNPFKNGPGYEAGMQKDDIIFKVEGEEVTGVDINQVVSKIKGKEGTMVLVTVYRPSTDEYIDMTIERRVVQYPTVEWEMLDDSVGYIRIVEFDDVTVEQFNTAVEGLTAQGAKGLIFDVRDNPGGLMDVVCSVVDRVLPKDSLIVYTLDREGEREENYAKDEAELSLPMVILTNGNSASASEIFTAALKDHNKATVIGTTTFGKGIVQVIIPLGDGSGVKVTQSEYYTPNDVCIHGDGIAPDIEVELDRETLKAPEGADPDATVIDNQMQAGIDELYKMFE